MHYYRSSIIIFSYHNYVTLSRIMHRCFSSSSSKTICNYEVLGVNPTATSKEIKDAYYEKSKQFHPDVNSSVDASAKFQQVSSAYDVLSDEKLRSEYDYNRGYKGDMRPQQKQPLYQEFRRNPEDYSEMNYHDLKAKFKVRSRVRKTKEAKDMRDKFYSEWMEELKRHQAESTKSDDFYDNLSPEMKETYKEFLDRKAEFERQTRERMQNAGEQSSSLLLIYLVIPTAIIFALEFLGKYMQIYDDEPERKPQDNKTAIK